MKKNSTAKTSIQKKTTIVALIALMSVVLSLLVYIVYRSYRHNELVDMLHNEMTLFSDNVWKTKSALYANTVKDNAAWDDLVDMVSHIPNVDDEAWLDENYGYMVDAYSAAMVGIFTANGMLMYSKLGEKYKKFDFFDYVLDYEHLRTCFRDTGLVNFYVEKDTVLMEYFGGTIVPSSDIEHKTTPHGYLFIARDISSDVINDFRESTGAISVKLFRNDTERNKYSLDTINTVAVCKTLYDYNNIQEAYLLTVYDNSIQRFLAKITPIFYILALICLISMIILVVYVYTHFIRPIGELNSIASRPVSSQTFLMSSDNEFGSIANEISNLRVEINESNGMACSILDAMREECLSSLKKLNDPFLISEPRDINGGDFCLIRQQGNKVMVALGDSREHGMRGALLDSLCISMLQAEAISLDSGLSPALVLDKINDTIIKVFGNGIDLTFGMEISLLVYDTQTMMGHFACARRPMMYIRNGEMFMLRGDRMLLGNPGNESCFSWMDVQFMRGDRVLMISNGVSEQKSPNGNKLKVSAFQQIVAEVSELSGTAIKNHILKTLDKWCGDNPRTGDVTMLSFVI